MEAFLIDEWRRALDGEPVDVHDRASQATARSRALELGSRLAVPADVLERTDLVIHELAELQLRYGSGAITTRPSTRGDERGLEVIAVCRSADLGELTNVRLAPRPAQGTPTILRAVTDVDFDVRRGEALMVRARIFARHVPRHLEVGVFGRAFEETPPSGDHLAVHRQQNEDVEELTVGVCDGLGHGAEAHDAARLAIEAMGRELRREPLMPLDALTRAIDSAIAGTRGAAMTIARLVSSHIDTERRVSVSAVGNVDAWVFSGRGLDSLAPVTTAESLGPGLRVRRLPGIAGVLGAKRSRALRVHVEHEPIAPKGALIIASDGVALIRTEQDVAFLSSDLRRMHVAGVARRIVERSGRADDALAVVIH